MPLLQRAGALGGFDPHPLLPHGPSGSTPTHKSGDSSRGWLEVPLAPEEGGGGGGGDSEELADQRKAQRLLFDLQFPGAAHTPPAGDASAHGACSVEGGGEGGRACGREERERWVREREGAARKACRDRRAVVNSFDRAYWGLAVSSLSSSFLWNPLHIIQELLYKTNFGSRHDESVSRASPPPPWLKACGSSCKVRREVASRPDTRRDVQTHLASRCASFKNGGGGTCLSK